MSQIRLLEMDSFSASLYTVLVLFSTDCNGSNECPEMQEPEEVARLQVGS